MTTENANLSNNGDREVDFGSHGGGENGEYIGFKFGEICKLFAM